MRYTQRRRHRRIPLPTAFFVPEMLLPDGPQSTTKLLNPKRFLRSRGIFQGADGRFLPAVREGAWSVAARRVDPVEQRAAGFEAADVVEDDRGGGRGVGEGGNVRRHDDARVVPERVAGGQRLVAKDVEHGPRELPRGEGREQILLDEMSAAG